MQGDSLESRLRILSLDNLLLVGRDCELAAWRKSFSGFSNFVPFKL